MNSLLFVSCLLACVGLAVLTNSMLPPLPAEGECFNKCNDGICENTNCVDFNNDGKCDVCTEGPVDGLCQCLKHAEDGSCENVCQSEGVGQRCERTDCKDEDKDGWCDVSVCDEYKDGKCVEEDCEDNDNDGFCDNLCEIDLDEEDEIELNEEQAARLAKKL